MSQVPTMPAMGVERARVVEVHAPASASGRTGSGYVVAGGLVLTGSAVVGRQGATHVRPSGTAVWYPALRVWTSATGDVALLALDDEFALPPPPGRLRWGRVEGRRPVPVTALGFAPMAGRPERWRDADQFFGHLHSAGPSLARGTLAVEASATSRVSGDGLHGAALFAGADVVGVLVAGIGPFRAMPISAVADDPSFVASLGVGAGGLDLTPISAPAGGLSIL